MLIPSKQLTEYQIEELLITSDQKIQYKENSKMINDIYEIIYKTAEHIVAHEAHSPIKLELYIAITNTINKYAKRQIKITKLP